MSPRSLFLTFGPVQEYLSQARRTRDLWAGSYLLSYLAAHALHRAQQAGGHVVIPSLADNPLFAAVASGGQANPPGDRVGSVPHVAEIEIPDGKEPREIADAAVQAWHAAWQRVAGAVQYYAEAMFPGWASATSKLWEHQINPAEMWTATWVVNAADMGRRKTLRDFTLSHVQGEKCTVCGARQALHNGEESLRGVRSFWAGVAERFDGLEIQPNGRERLCAPCTVRRLYPRPDVVRDALGWVVQPGYPSTATMATLPWRDRVLEKGQTAEELRRAVAQYVRALRETGISPALAHDRFPGLYAKAQQWSTERDAALAFLRCDGDWLSVDGIRAESSTDAQRNRLFEEFRQLAQAATREGIPQPGTSYVLLAMDGDNMGKLLARAAEARPDDGKQRVSEALGRFSQQVYSMVEGQNWGANGVLIYAGGDDVLALLPSTTALSTAQAIRQDYHNAFKAVFGNELTAVFPEDGPQPTISAGLVFAHTHAPLQQVVKAAHDMLDEEAKKTPGKDALGVRVWKRGGVALSFACRWDSGVVEDVSEIVRKIQSQTYSRSFLYRLRALVAVTGAMDATEEGCMLVAEYLKSRRRELPRTEAEQAVAPLQRMVRQQRGAIDPIMLAEFLSEEG